MAWKDWSYTKKFALVGAIFLGLVHFVIIGMPLIQNEYKGSLLYISTVDFPLWLVGIIFFNSLLMNSSSFNFILFGIFGTIMYSVIGALIGALIGWIYGKIRGK